MKDGKSTEHDSDDEWCQQCQNDGMELSSSMLMEQARLFLKELKLEHECDCCEEWHEI